MTFKSLGALYTPKYIVNYLLMCPVRVVITIFDRHQINL